MPLTTALKTQGFALSYLDRQRINHHIARLERRLRQRPDPTAELVLKQQGTQRQIQADLRIRLGPLGPQLISHQAAETADRAARLAIEDVERQLERRVAFQRNEPSFAVPSRREPHRERPAYARMREATGETTEIASTDTANEQELAS